MPGKKRLRWPELDHFQEPLYDVIMTSRASRENGAVAEFLAKKAAEQEAKTFQWYSESLMQFCKFLEGRGLGLVSDLNEHNVNLFRLQLREKGLSENTVSNRLRALKAFARWMAKRGLTDSNVLDDLRAPQSYRPQFDLIPDDVRLKLFSMYRVNTFLGSRNLVPAIGKERYNQPLVVSLSNHERLILRQAQGERFWAGLCDADLGH